MPVLLNALLVVVGAATGAVVFVEVVHLVLVRLGRRSPLLADLARTAHRPFLVAVTLSALRLGIRLVTGPFPGRAAVLHALLIGVIATAAWLVGALLLVLEDAALARWRTDVPDNVRARRLHTQVVMLRRVTVAAIVVVAVGVALMTFPPVRTVGASVLASAGVISVVAALAAQSMLGNLFAGLQLAFSGAVRIDDVVVVEGEWGRVEELTLSYVVVQIWDDRRLILPTSYFTTKPFQNWTRTASAVLGTAEVDVDFSAPVEALRAEVRRVCEGSDLWDGRVCVLQVTEAVGGTVRLRALVSAADAGALWDLRCLVRERLVGWVWQHGRDALPRWRADLSGADGAGADGAGADGAGGPPAAPPAVQRAAPAGPPGDDARVFGGSGDGEARSASFLGPDEPASTPRR